jgi:hypothetical protein
VRTVNTTFGNPNLQNPVQYQIGVTEAESGQYYVKVQFSNGSWFRTKREYDADKAKGLVAAITKHTKNKDFPFENAHGEAMFTKYDPTVTIDF